MTAVFCDEKLIPQSNNTYQKFVLSLNFLQKEVQWLALWKPRDLWLESRNYNAQWVVFLRYSSLLYRFPENLWIFTLPVLEEWSSRITLDEACWLFEWMIIFLTAKSPKNLFGFSRFSTSMYLIFGASSLHTALNSREFSAITTTGFNITAERGLHINNNVSELNKNVFPRLSRAPYVNS